jgi:hypothetical protein
MLTKQSFQIDEVTAERDALVLPSNSRGAEIRFNLPLQQLLLQLGTVLGGERAGTHRGRKRPLWAGILAAENEL